MTSAPTMASEYDAELRDWTMADHGDDLRIHGCIYSDKLTSGKHPFPDGEPVVTSTIRALDHKSMIAVTRSGTRYKLATPPLDPDAAALVERLRADKTVTRYHGDHEISFSVPASTLEREAASHIEARARQAAPVEGEVGELIEEARRVAAIEHSGWRKGFWLKLAEALSSLTKGATPVALEREGLAPEAWLIRQLRGDETTVLAGYVFKSEPAAKAAAMRLTNGWRLCLPFPVVSAALQAGPGVGKEGLVQNPKQGEAAAPVEEQGGE